MIEIGLGSEFGVAVTSYSGMHSRMWAWRIATLEVVGLQDVKGRASLIDITKDGCLASYVIERHHKNEFYLAVCRPPYWHAVWLKKAFHLMRAYVYFKDSGWEYWCEENIDTSEDLVERDGGKVIERSVGDVFGPYRSRVELSCWLETNRQCKTD